MTDAARPVFEPLNDLERLLMAATSGGPEQRAAFEAAVVEQPLWAVLADGARPEDDVIRLRSVALKDSRPATALFTARERAEQVMGPDAEPATWPGRVLIGMIRENPAVLNPGHGYGVRWGPDALAALLGAPNPERGQRMPTQVADPAETPEGLVEALTRELTAEPAVRGAWLALARWADGEQGFLLDVRAAPGESFLQPVMNRALDGLELDARLDVVIGSPQEGPGAGLAIVAPR